MGMWKYVTVLESGCHHQKFDTIILGVGPKTRIFFSLVRIKSGRGVVLIVVKTQFWWQMKTMGRGFQDLVITRNRYPKNHGAGTPPLRGNFYDTRKFGEWAH